MKQRSRLLSLALILSLTACTNGSGGGGGGVGPETVSGDPSVAARTAPLAGGDSDCPAGGILVETGIDENGNGVLDTDEVDQSEKVCNGTPGADGLPGEDGTPGDGGLNVFISFVQEAAGENCASGGIQINSGLDRNRNDVLDPSEISATSYLCNIVVTGWGIAAPIETDNAGSAFLPQVAVDGSGNAIAVWDQSDGIRTNIWASRYVVGVGWGTPEAISFSTEGAFRPQVAVDGSGNAIAVWEAVAGLQTDIWAGRYVVGVGWGRPELIEPDTLGTAFAAQVTVDGSGNAIAVWVSRDKVMPGENNIWANQYSVGSGWGIAETIGTISGGSAELPQVAIDGSGNAIAVWRQSDGTRFNIWATLYAGTAWGSARLIESDNAGDANNPQLSVDESGNAIAVWEQSDGTRSNIWANRYVAADFDWGSAELIESNNDGRADSPQVSTDGSGNAFVVWRQSDGTRDNIWSNRYVAADAAWGSAALIETNNDGNASRPQVAVDGSGNAIAVWFQRGERGLSNIWANRYPAGTAWGSAELIETNNDGDAVIPQVAVDGSGNAIAIWNWDNGVQGHIWANRFTAP